MSMIRKNKGPHSTRADRAVLETFQLYHAWLGYLLQLLGKEELRVPADRVKAALGHLSCSARREGNEYVITLRQVEGEGADDRHTAAR